VRNSLRLLAFVLTLPIGAIGCLGLLVGVVNIDVMAFEHTVTVHNGAGEVIWVTPIDGQNPLRRFAVPELKSPPLALSSLLGRRAIRVEAGATHNIRYDSDDMMVTELLVETQARTPRSLPVEWTRTEYEVADVDQLPPAHPTAVRASRQVPHAWKVLPMVLAMALAPIFAFLWWRSGLRKAQARPAGL